MVFNNPAINSLLGRRSIRQFQDAAVSPEELAVIVDCGRFAASARNLQPWHFTVVTDKALIDGLVAAFVELVNEPGSVVGAAVNTQGVSYAERVREPGFSNFHHAPAVIVISGDASAKFAVSDCGGAAQNMALAAHALGLGSCIVGNIMPLFENEERYGFAGKLGVPSGFTPMLTVAVGRPAGPLPEAPARKADNVNYK